MIFMLCYGFFVSDLENIEFVFCFYIIFLLVVMMLGILDIELFCIFELLRFIFSCVWEVFVKSRKGEMVMDSEYDLFVFIVEDEDVELVNKRCKMEFLR